MAGERSGSGRATSVVAGLLAGFAVCLGAAFGALAAVLGEGTSTVAGVGGAVFAAFAVLGYVLVSRLAQPLDRLALDVRIIARENPNYALRPGSNYWVRQLTDGIEAMHASLARTQADAARALAEARRQEAEQKRWLEAILLDLTEGIVVCNLQHQVLLYNQTAADLLGGTHAFGLGRSLFPSLTREPVLHALERQMLQLDSGRSIRGTRFMCGAAEGQRLLGARLGIVLDAAGAPNGYVLSFAEVGEEHAALSKRDDLLEAATEGLRGSLASLRAAAETLAHNPALPQAKRASFQEVVLGESVVLSNRLDELARGYRRLGGGRWLMAEVYSSDLTAYLARRLVGSPIQITATGLPHWLYGDSLSLLALIESLLRQLHALTGVEAYDVAFSRTENRVYLDLLWQGNPVPAAQLESWLSRPLTGGLGPLTGRDVLRRHGSEAWSQPAGAGTARLRIPLTSAEAAPMRDRPQRPQRPEFYDFDLLRHPVATGRFADRPLKQLSYVAFDLETTGLKPAEGDQVVSIAAVRIVNGRILTTETFERLINPGRPIPESSVRFHGITDAMVRDKPPFAVVIPAFHRFAADAVLVAHNAAFDVTFLNRAAEGIATFDQPVVDTLLLSAHLYPGEADHSLDTIAARLGLEVTGRHRALGDCLLTAAILLRLLNQCEERGITRLGELIAATDMTARLRAAQHGLSNHAAGSAS